MNKTIYFHIDELSRDAVVAANLEQVMKPHGVEVIYGNRTLSGLISKSNTFRKFDLYVFPSIDLFKTYVPDLNEFSAPVVLLPTEELGRTGFDAKRLLSKQLGNDPIRCKSWSERASAFCFWGPAAMQLVESAAPALLPKCHIVGHPRHDYRCQGNRSSLRHSENTKIRVGLTSHFMTFNSFNRRHILEAFPGEELGRNGDTITGRGIEDRLYMEALDLRLFYQVIQNLDPTIYEISVRVHPREDRTTWQKIITKRNMPVRIAPWDQPFMHWLQEIDYVVGPPSTSYYDCFVAGKVPISTCDMVLHRQEHLIGGSEDENRILEFVLRPKSMEELLGLLSVKPEQQPSEFPEEVLALLEQATTYPDSANSIDALAKVCLHVLDSFSTNSRFTSINRIQFNMISLAANRLATLKRTFRGSGPEQSSSFLLTSKRRSFIRKLAWSNERPNHRCDEPRTTRESPIS